MGLWETRLLSMYSTDSGRNIGSRHIFTASFLLSRRLSLPPKRRKRRRRRSRRRPTKLFRLPQTGQLSPRPRRQIRTRSIWIWKTTTETSPLPPLLPQRSLQKRQTQISRLPQRPRRQRTLQNNSEPNSLPRLQSPHTNNKPSNTQINQRPSPANQCQRA